MIGCCDFCGSEDVEVQEYKITDDEPVTFCKVCAGAIPWPLHGTQEEARIMKVLTFCTNEILKELRKGKP